LARRYREKREAQQPERDGRRLQVSGRHLSSEAGASPRR
jgi:hypothetical protein